MGIVNKIVIGIVLLALVFGWISVTRAGGDVVITNIDINYDCITYECLVGLEHLDEENVTVCVELFIDNVKAGEANVSLNVTYFKGFRIQTCETVVFELPCNEGIHSVTVYVYNEVIDEVYSGCEYEAYGCVNEEEDIEEEEVEEEEDWLSCPYGMG